MVCCVQWEDFLKPSTLFVQFNVRTIRYFASPTNNPTKWYAVYYICSEMYQEMLTNSLLQAVHNNGMACTANGCAHSGNQLTPILSLTRRMQALWGEPERASRTLAVIVA